MKLLKYIKALNRHILLFILEVTMQNFLITTIPQKLKLYIEALIHGTSPFLIKTEYQHRQRFLRKKLWCLYC